MNCNVMYSIGQKGGNISVFLRVDVTIKIYISVTQQYLNGLDLRFLFSHDSHYQHLSNQ